MPSMSLPASGDSKPNRLQGRGKYAAIAGLCLGALGALAVTMSRSGVNTASSLGDSVASGDVARLRSRMMLSTSESAENDSAMCLWSVGCSDSAECSPGLVCEHLGSYSQCVEPPYSTMEDGVRTCYATDAEAGCSTDSDCCNPHATCSSGICRLDNTDCQTNVYDVDSETDPDAETEAAADPEDVLELVDAAVEEEADAADAVTVEAHDLGLGAMAADSVCARNVPCAVGKTSGNFVVRVGYTAAARRVIVVDLLDTNNVWYGKGQVTVNAGSGNVDISVKIYNQARAGSNYLLKTWVVDANVYASSPASWEHQIAAIQSSLALGTSTCKTQIPSSIKCGSSSSGSKPTTNSLCATSLPCAFPKLYGKVEAKVRYTAKGKQRIVMQVEDKHGKIHGMGNKKINPGSNTVTLSAWVSGLWKADFKLMIWTVNEWDYKKSNPRQYAIRRITGPLAVGTNKCKSQVAAGSRCPNYSVWPGNSVGSTSPAPSPTPTPTPTPTPAPKPSPAPTPAPKPTPTPSPSPSGRYYTSSRASSAAQKWYNEFMGQAAFGNNQIPNNPKYPNALGAGCSGGACSGVTSESQGYALMSAGWLSDGSRTRGFYHGWRSMADGPGGYVCDACGDSASGAKCGQANPGNGYQGVCANDRSTYAAGPANYRGCCNCLTMGTSKGYLSAWKYENGQLAGTGSASDGDIDAITGMIYHAEATNDNTVRRYALEAILAFIFTDIGYGSPFDTRTAGGKNYYILKPGSCFGGFTNSYFEPYCYNPSYFAPAQMRLFKEYLQKHGSLLNGTPYSNRQGEFAAVLDGVIDTGYQLMYQTQCQNGPVPNWVTLSSSSNAKPWEGLHFTCSASGTAAQTFGADASRAPWRVCLDYLWYPDQSQVTTPDGTKYGAKQFCNRFAKSIMDQMKSTNCVSAGAMSSCKPVANALANKLNGCGSRTSSAVTTVDDVQYNGFMYGPLMVPMMVPVDGYESVQQQYLDALVAWGADQFASGQTYFSLSQLMIAYNIVGGNAQHPLK